MKEKIKNIWKRACAFFVQADKQKHLNTTYQEHVKRVEKLEALLKLA